MVRAMKASQRIPLAVTVEGRNVAPRWKQRPPTTRLPGLLSRASQVRMLPGAPRIRDLQRAQRRSSRFALFVVSDFIARSAPRGIIARILLVLTGTRDVGVTVEIGGWRERDPPATGIAPVYTEKQRRTPARGPLTALRKGLRVRRGVRSPRTASWNVVE